MSDKRRRPAAACCLTRRELLLGGGAVLGTLLLPGLPGEGRALVRAAGYPRKRVGRVSRLVVDKPVEFFYPHGHAQCAFLLVKLGREAAGGAGPDKDIVAFSLFCTHMGEPMRGLYKTQFKALGACRRHLTVFDLRRRGMVVSGHGTEGLPQALLETRGDSLFATGVMGLVYGFHDNKAAP